MRRRDLSDASLLIHFEFRKHKTEFEFFRSIFFSVWFGLAWLCLFCYCSAGKFIVIETFLHVTIYLNQMEGKIYFLERALDLR